MKRSHALRCPIHSSHLRRIPALLSRLLATPAGWATVAFAICYIVVFQYLHATRYDDPTSLFFDTYRGYRRGYSLDRERQALSYLDAVSNGSVTPPDLSSSHSSPALCLGIATIARRRQGAEYVAATIGSLLEGLTAEERANLHLVTLIAHNNPRNHPIYRSEWLRKVVDEVLTYNVTDAQKAQIIRWENTHQYKNKTVFDYTYTMRHCYDTGAPWIAMLEDDVLAARGWYPRAVAAVEHADDQMRWDGVEWLYLRLFYTELFLGWNSEEWPRYAAWSSLVTLSVAAALIFARASTPHLRSSLSNPVIGLITFTVVPACIMLYFLVGRGTVQPLQPGVHEMPRFGCCSQGFVFPRAMVPRVIEQLQGHMTDEEDKGYVDQLLEQWANDEGLVRWVTVPSLLQHIGEMSSKGPDSDWNDDKIWSWQFERYDVDAGLSS